jgi:hypothetical protein
VRIARVGDPRRYAGSSSAFDNPSRSRIAARSRPASARTDGATLVKAALAPVVAGDADLDRSDRRREDDGGIRLGASVVDQRDRRRDGRMAAEGHLGDGEK